MIDFGIGDTVEYNNTKCYVMVVNEDLIGTDFEEDGCIVEDNYYEDSQYKLLNIMGFKDEDPLFWINRKELKLIKKLEDY